MNKKKVLSVFSLVSINLIAVDSLRAFPISAEYGVSLIFYYICGALFYMIPVALCAAEMASTWPEAGGLYAWAKKAFGVRMATLAAWLLWIYNIVWYPTVLSFLASTVYFIFNPAMADNKHVIVATIFVCFWLATAVNFFGMQSSKRFSNIGAVIGTLLPIAIIISLTCAWLFTGKPIVINLAAQSWIPSLTNIDQLAILSGMLFGLVGIEMSAVHAKDVKNPSKDYPKALLISALTILVTSILSSLAIAFVIPQNTLSLSSGLIQTFSIYLTAFHMGWAIPVVVVCILIGGLSGLSAWVIGPSKCILQACYDGTFPKVFAKKNKHDVPTNLLLLQGGIFTLLCIVFWFFPGFNDSYWLLSNITAQISVLFYVILFATLIQLRRKFPDVVRPYKIPGNNLVAYIIAGIGLLSCVFVFSCGMLPPQQIKISHIFDYEIILLAGVFMIICVPFFFKIRKS